MLRAEEVTFQYPRAPAAVLSRWSESFEAGTSTALVGVSGRGKSTLLYVLGLMLRPTGGAVNLDGVPVSSLPDAQKARLRATKFGFVFQDAALDQTRSVLDNVTEAALYAGLDRRTARRRGRDLLERFEVDVDPDRRPGQVSGGQAQRIALCRALLTSPHVLLADEPTGNLDPVTTHTVVKALQDHARDGGVVVVVTHSPDVAAACDRTVGV